MAGKSKNSRFNCIKFSYLQVMGGIARTWGYLGNAPVPRPSRRTFWRSPSRPWSLYWAVSPWWLEDWGCVAIAWLGPSMQRTVGTVNDGKWYTKPTLLFLFQKDSLLSCFTVGKTLQPFHFKAKAQRDKVGTYEGETSYLFPQNPGWCVLPSSYLTVCHGKSPCY